MSEVRFSDYQRVFRLYTEAIAGRPFGLLPSAEAPDNLQLAGHDLPAWDGETVYLPRSVDELGDERANFSVYKIAILHQLGYEDLGTARLAWDECRRRLGTRLVGYEAPPSGDGDLLHFFAAFKKPELARRLFNVLEDARIDAHLLRTYPGMRARLSEIMSYSLFQRPALEGVSRHTALLEGLTQWSLGAQRVHAPTTLADAIAALRECCAKVQAESADVYTTAVSTVSAYEVIEERRHRTSRSGAEAHHPPDAEAPEESDSTEIHAEIALDDLGHDDEPAPVTFRGRFQPEALTQKVLLDELRDELERLEREQGLTQSLPADLRATEVEITSVEDAEGLEGGQAATDLEVAPGERDELESRQERIDELRDRLGLQPHGKSAKHTNVFLYDEWDHLSRSYRPDWTTLRQELLDPVDPKPLLEALDAEADLRRNVRRLFGQIKPELLQRIHRLDDGEDIDLDAAIDARVDRRARNELPERVYTRRQRKERDVAAAFLLDMSASTDSEMPEPEPPEEDVLDTTKGKKIDYTGILGDEDDWTYFAGPSAPVGRRKVIDVEKEAVLLIAEALNALGDTYGVYGFSGFGRSQVDFFVAKELQDPFDDSVRGRIAAMKPQRSTRMGPAIRHTIDKLSRQEQRMKVLVILSDGYPQDFDYGDDRSSRAYGIQDTMMALREAEQRGIHTFCITVDPAGHDYLREMCPDRRYLVIDDIAALPGELPKVYRALTT